RALSVPSGPEPTLLDDSRSGMNRGPVAKNPAPRRIRCDLYFDQTYASVTGLARHGRRGGARPVLTASTGRRSEAPTQSPPWRSRSVSLRVVDLGASGGVAGRRRSGWPFSGVSR